MPGDTGPADSTVDAVDDAPAEPGRDLPAVDRERYDLGAEISRGGLGRVLHGRDRHLDRVVAIKQLLNHNPRFEARFRREARITARLQHPGIVPVYEAGRWPGGEPFYAMKLVEGRTLKDELAGAERLDDRLALIPRLIAVCEAMAYAHSQRVIHRDLKPANIMLGPFGEAYVVDWGLAKDLDAPDDADLAIVVAVGAGDADGDAGAAATAEPGLTTAGTVLGTPPYLAPEQARGEPVGTAADVYALGAVLYHALAGAAPYSGMRGGSDTLIERVCAGPPAAVATVERGAPRELAAIVDKAMARAPGDRYPTAGELVADLRRFQTGQLVGAHRYSPRQLIARWLRRNRRVVAIGLAALLAIALIAVIAIRRVVSERDVARSARISADDARQRAEVARSTAEQRTSALLVAQAERWLDVDPTVALAWLKRHAAGAAPDAERIRAIAIDAVGRGAARDLVRGLLAVRVATDGSVIGVDGQQRVAVWTPGAAPVPITAAVPPGPVAASADGAQVVWADTAIDELDRATGTTRELAPLVAGMPAVLVIAGGTVAIGETTGDVRVVELATGASRTLHHHRSAIARLYLSADGAYLLSFAVDQSIALWRVATGAEVPLPVDSQLTANAFSPRGDRLAWSDERVVRWMALDGSPAPVVHAIRIPLLAPSMVELTPDASALAIASHDVDADSIRIVDLATGGVRVLGTTHGWITLLQYSPDGRTLISGSHDGGPLIAWDVATGDRRTLRGHGAMFSAVGFTGDSASLVTGDVTREVRRWPIAPAREQVIVADSVDRALIAPLAGAGVVAIDNVDVEVAELADGVPAPRRIGRGPLMSHLVAAPSGDRVAWATADGTYAWARGDAQATRIDPTGAREVAVSSDGTRIASGELDATVHVWTAGARGAPVETVLRGQTDQVIALAFSPDGARLATGAEDGSLWLWDLATGAGRSLGTGASVWSLLFLPDGSLACGRGNGELTLRAAGGAGAIRTLAGHTAGITRMVLVDGALVTAAADGTARIWDLATGTARVLVHRGRVEALAALDGGRIATGNTVDADGDATIRIWDVATGGLIAEWHGHTSGIAELAVSGDRRWLISGGADKTVRRWPLDPPAPLPRADLAWLSTFTSVDLGPDDVVATP